MIDLLDLGSLAVVTAEWLALGWLSGVSVHWPGATWALRLLVGSALLAATQLILAAAGVGFTSIPAVLVTAAVVAGAVRTLQLPLRPECDASQEARSVRIDAREAAGWLLLGLVVVAAVVRSLLVPESGWDAYSHWGLRAQAFALAGTIVNARSEHEYYPPLVPLLEAWLYVHRGAVSIDLGKTVWAPIGAAFAVYLGWQLRLSLAWAWLAPVLAAGIVVGTTALLESFWTGQADLALTAYLSVACLSVFRWLQTRDPTLLVHMSIFAFAAALTKFEGLPRLGVMVLALAVEATLARQRRPWQPAAALGFAALAASVAWTSYELTHGIALNGEHLGPFQPLAIGSVAIALLAVFGGIRTGGSLAVTVLAWVVAGRALLLPPLRLLALVVLGEFAATLIGFLLSATSPAVEVRTSATRLVLQILPLALFVGAVELGRVLDETSTYNRRGR